MPRCQSLSPLPYPLPVGVAVVEEGLEVILQPFVVVVLDVVAKSFYELVLVDIFGYFYAFKLAVEEFSNNVSIKHVLFPWACIGLVIPAGDFALVVFFFFETAWQFLGGCIDLSLSSFLVCLLLEGVL